MVEVNELLTDGVTKLSIIGESISLFDLNVESTEDVAMEYRKVGLSRVVVATKDVEVGTKIIRERPVLVFDNSGDWEEMVTLFLALDETSKNGILDMFHPPLSSPTDISILTGRKLSIDPNLVQKLITICNCNAHEYYGNDGEEYSEIQQTSFSTRLSSPKSSLFLFASKVAHSCNPNVTYSSKTNDGKLEYTVI